MLSLLERFVVLMYDRTSESMEVNEARKQLSLGPGLELYAFSLAEDNSTVLW